ncbi:MAG: Gfo/Idh/MocA family oxidoreductase [bacterium]
MSELLRVAVIGVGALGRHHARIYAELPNTELVAVVDTDAERAAIQAEATGAKAVTDYRSILGEVDAVSIVVPTVDHYQVARDALEAGVHVLVEKPITSALSEADDLIAIAKRNELTLQVGHVERFNPAVMALSGRLNNPLFVESHRLGPLAERIRDVGVVLDLMIHDLDLLLSLVKSEVAEIDAVGVPVVTPHEDIANARIRFVSGCVANVTVSRVTPERQRRIRFFQGDSYLALDYLVPRLEIYRKRTGSNGEVVIERETPDISNEEPLKTELRSFVNAVQHRTRPVVSGEDGRQALALAEKIVRMIGDRARAQGLI